MDRAITREWALDLADAGKVPPLAKRPAPGPRQHIVRFDGREANEERFSFRLTFPHDEDDPDKPPTQKQYDTVCDYYGEGPVSMRQAGYLISAWYYADKIRSVQRFKFSAPRRRLIHVAASAYILSHPEMRQKIRAWTDFSWREPGEAVTIERTRYYSMVMQFAHDLIADMQGAGAEIFG